MRQERPTSRCNTAPVLKNFLQVIFCAKALGPMLYVPLHFFQDWPINWAVLTGNGSMFITRRRLIITQCPMSSAMIDNFSNPSLFLQDTTFKEVFYQCISLCHHISLVTDVFNSPCYIANFFSNSRMKTGYLRKFTKHLPSFHLLENGKRCFLFSTGSLDT